jgi:hypothetical protein
LGTRPAARGIRLMLRITPRATAVLGLVAARRGLSADHGLRISDDSTDDGEFAVRVGIAERPRRGDTVTASAGLPVFLAPDVDAALQDAVLDADVVGEEVRVRLFIG